MEQGTLARIGDEDGIIGERQGAAQPGGKLHRPPIVEQEDFVLGAENDLRRLRMDGCLLYTSDAA
ncbi:MAG: hypothetical protein N2690_07540, partial [Rhodocyclaceae bacterium]|nr:hypothetical protein [Rhodocyclaceae bacterium]